MKLLDSYVQQGFRVKVYVSSTSLPVFSILGACMYVWGALCTFMSNKYMHICMTLSSMLSRARFGVFFDNICGLGVIM